MLVALARARLALYPPSTLAEDRQALAKAVRPLHFPIVLCHQSTWTHPCRWVLAYNKQQSDGSKAIVVWALMLRVAEKELLHRVIKRYGAAPAVAKPADARQTGESKRKRQPPGGNKKKKSKKSAAAKRSK
jgi:hypothetical protein